MILEKGARQNLADQFDVYCNTNTPPADVVFETSADVAVVTIAMSNPMFGAATTAGVLSLTAGTYSAAKSTSGTATVAQMSIYQGAGTKVAELTCGTGAQEVTISNTSIAKSDVIELQTLQITMPAS